MTHKEHFDAALDYIRKNINMDEVKKTQDLINNDEPVSMDDIDAFSTTIDDMMREYGYEHGIYTEWWEKFVNSYTEILLML